MKNILPILILIIVFVNCTSQKYDNQKPADFSVKIIDDINSYDTKTGIYIRQYINRDSTIKASITQKELNMIYELFKQYDFMSFPDEFECQMITPTKIPAFETTIEITYKGLHKKVANSDFCEKKIEQLKSDRFNEFSEAVKKIINNKSEIKSAKESDMFFM